jgi:hypothetical protein
LDDRVQRCEGDLSGHLAPRLTACSQAVEALDARARGLQSAVGAESVSRTEFEATTRTFLEQFQGEVAQALSAMHKKHKQSAKELESALRAEMQARVQGLLSHL